MLRQGFESASEWSFAESCIVHVSFVVSWRQVGPSVSWRSISIDDPSVLRSDVKQWWCDTLHQSTAAIPVILQMIRLEGTLWAFFRINTCLLRQTLGEVVAQCFHRQITAEDDEEAHRTSCCRFAGNRKLEILFWLLRSGNRNRNRKQSPKASWEPCRPPDF